MKKPQGTLMAQRRHLQGDREEEKKISSHQRQFLQVAYWVKSFEVRQQKKLGKAIQHKNKDNYPQLEKRPDITSPYRFQYHSDENRKHD